MILKWDDKFKQAVSKYKEMKKERNVDETIREISKHLTMLNKTKFITDQPDEKQFDSKFTVNIISNNYYLLNVSFITST